MMVETGGLSYSDYLQLDKILSAQECQSEVHGRYF
jgi:tryptophan 2,3-dioxygenase